MDQQKAFSIILRGRALQFYFGNYHGKHNTIGDLYNRARERFLTGKQVRALLCEWVYINFNTSMSKNSDTKGTEYPETLFSWLQDAQSSLTKEYQNEAILQNKVLKAVKNVESCILAYFKTTSDLPGIITDLHASSDAISPRR